MTAVLLIAIGSSFAFKPASTSMPWYSINLGSATNPFCDIVQVNTDCKTNYTGPQCTAYAGGVLKPIWEVPYPAGPICVTPLRQFFQ